MAQLTAPDASKLNITASLVLRARRTISGEKEGGARCRVDWVDKQLVLETIDEAAAAIRAELNTFVSLNSRDGSAIWFNAAQAVGPLPLKASEADGVVRSAIKIVGYRQYVTQTPDEVRQLIVANGGKVVL